MKEYRVVAQGRDGVRVVVLSGASRQVAKATAKGCTAFDNAKVQVREVLPWRDA